MPSIATRTSRERPGADGQVDNGGHPNPTADTLTAVGAAVEPFDSAVETLTSDVLPSC